MAMTCFEKHCCRSFFRTCSMSIPGSQEIRAINRRMQAIRIALRERKRAADSLGLSARWVQVVLAAYIASRYDRNLAVDILKAVLRKRSKMNSESAAHIIGSQLDRWFTSLSERQLRALILPESPWQQRVCDQGARLVAAARCVQWVAQENFSRGVAPSPYALVETYVAELRSLGLHQPPLKQASARRWVRCWRKLWHVSRAQLHCRDVQPEEDVQRKAGRTGELFYFSVSPWSPFLAPPSGPRSGAFSQLLYFPKVIMVQVPFLGSPKGPRNGPRNGPINLTRQGAGLFLLAGFFALARQRHEQAPPLHQPG